jgi:hypothetical protein
MIARTLLALALLGGAAQAQDKVPSEEQKKRAEDLKKLIADKKAEVAKLEAELAKIEPQEIPPAVRARILEKWPKAPDLNGFEKGAFGMMSRPPDFNEVEKVVDEHSALIALSTAGAPRNARTFIVVGGIDTSRMREGSPYSLEGIYYVLGDVKVGTVTYTKLLPFTPTGDELKARKK